jgi:diguanylate cyclase (GGDEF)-like protein/PAS domain S-box-containing protein
VLQPRPIGADMALPMLRARGSSPLPVSAGSRSRLDGQRLSLGLLAAAVACLGLSTSLVFGSIPLSRLDSKTTRDLQAEMSKTQVLVSGEANAERGYLLTGDKSFLAEFADKQHQVDALLGPVTADAQPTVVNLIAGGMPDYRSFLSDHARVVSLYQTGDRAAATALALGHDRQSRTAAEVAFAAAATEIVRDSAQESAHDAALAERASAALIALGIGLLIVAAEVARRTRRQQCDAEASRESALHFRTLVDNVPAAVYAVDLDATVLAWNPGATAMFGWSEAEAVGHILPFDDDHGELSRLWAEVTTGRSFIGVEATRRCRDGTVIDVSFSTSPVLDEAGQVVRVIVIENHRRSDRLLAAIVSASRDAILSTSTDGAVTSWNAGAEAMFGHSAAEIIGQPLTTLCPPHHWARQQGLLELVLDGNSVVGGEGIGLRKDGTEFPVAVTASPLLQADGTVIGLSGVARDITAQKALEEALEQRPLHDELTGLPNRVLFVDRVSLALARLPRHQGVVAVLFVDVDHFKVINDSLGHDQGDRLLVMIAEQLQSAVRPGDTVARFGGDEFAVLCEDVADDSEAAAIGQRIQNVVTMPFDLDGRDHHVTVSAGIATAHERGASAADLVRDADSAMYQAKAAGRARSVLFAPAMRTRAHHRLDTELSLRRAISDGELRLYYQPIINLATGRTDGVEALVRWQHPTKGIIPPNDFIPIAEESGLIVPLGEWVLGEACRQTHVWHLQHPDLAQLTVAVNLSGRQIAQADVVNVIANVLAHSRLDPSRLVLEITESVLMRDATYTVSVLAALKVLGVGLSIDDFGTGYSSLSYLKTFPVDILKIDKSFVDGLGADRDDSAIVAATINLAHSLGLVTVAEGTETAIQVETLTELGCDKAQGYLFCRPQPAAAITQHLLRDSQAVPADRSNLT